MRKSHDEVVGIASVTLLQHRAWSVIGDLPIRCVNVFREVLQFDTYAQVLNEINDKVLQGDYPINYYTHRDTVLLEEGMIQVKKDVRHPIGTDHLHAEYIDSHTQDPLILVYGKLHTKYYLIVVSVSNEVPDWVWAINMEEWIDYCESIRDMLRRTLADKENEYLGMATNTTDAYWLFEHLKSGIKEEALRGSGSHYRDPMNWKLVLDHIIIKSVDGQLTNVNTPW